MFRESGRSGPTAHPLTESERAKVKAAVETLPPLHRRVLKTRLRIISFLDGMPNTALTSMVNPDDTFRLFDVTINAAILRQNVSEWLTQKERSCFDHDGSSLSVSIDAGTRLDALVYVLLHEATHIVDASERITPPLGFKGRSAIGPSAAACPFIEGVWSDVSLPAPPYRDPVRERVRFYAEGRTIAVHQAPEVYAWLRRTPFVSLYGGRNWPDDLAEFVSVYHLTEVLHQPYRIVIRRDSQEVFMYEPMKSPLVRRRIGQMKRFYEDG
jgi:hypothetical protein